MKVKCKICGKTFDKIPSSNKKFCSVECYRTYQKSDEYRKVIEKMTKTIRQQYKNGRKPHNYGLREKRKTINCVICGKTFEVFESEIIKGKKCCSWKCYVKYRQDPKTNPSFIDGRSKIECTCEYCGKTFYEKQARIKDNRGIYCSKACFNKALKEFGLRKGEKHWNWQDKKTEYKCIVCGKKFDAYPHEKRKFCGQDCYWEWLHGENSPTWAGGKSFEPYTPEFNKKLKQSIMKRDHFQCQLCKTFFPNYFGVHHIDYDKKNNDPENLIFLCASCHTRTNMNRGVWKLYFQQYQSSRDL